MTNLDEIQKKFYSLGISDKLHELNGLPVRFDPNWDYVGINVSGGADSALFTSLLAKYIQENGYKTKIKIISFVRVYTDRPWAGYISIDVYNKLKKMFPDVIVERIEGFIPPQFEESGPYKNPADPAFSGDRMVVSAYNQYAFKRHNLSRIYNCVTKNPNVKLNKAPHDRKVSIEDATAEQQEWSQLHPFKYVEKDWVIEQYFVNGWQDLLTTTRSCEGQFEGITWDTYEHGIPLEVCNNCFWCAERKWAMEEAAKKGYSL
jgi:hypothetical protein